MGAYYHATTLEWTQSCPGGYIWFSLIHVLVLLFLYVCFPYAIINVDVIDVVGVIVSKRQHQMHVHAVYLLFPLLPFFMSNGGANFRWLVL